MPGQLARTFETKRFQLVDMKLTQSGIEMFEKHYADFSTKGFFNGLVEYAHGLVGDNAIKTRRKMIRGTKPFD